MQGTTHLVEPTVVDVTIDDRTWRREETHDAHVQTNVDHQHEQTVNTTERHLLLWAVGYWSERHTTADLYCSLVCQQTFDDWWVFIVRQPARRRSTSVIDHCPERLVFVFSDPFVVLSFSAPDNRVVVKSCRRQFRTPGSYSNRTTTATIDVINADWERLSFMFIIYGAHGPLLSLSGNGNTSVNYDLPVTNVGRRQHIIIKYWCTIEQQSAVLDFAKLK